MSEDKQQVADLLGISADDVPILHINGTYQLISFKVTNMNIDSRLQMLVKISSSITLSFPLVTMAEEPCKIDGVLVEVAQYIATAPQKAEILLTQLQQSEVSFNQKQKNNTYIVSIYLPIRDDTKIRSC